MNITYKCNQLQSTIIYGETVAAQLKKEKIRAKYIFIITNQRYYDLYAGKLMQLFGETYTLNWYICNNSVHCNNFIELESLLAFLAEFNQQKNYHVIGVGNEGVIQLTNYLQKVSVIQPTSWVLPLSIRALSKSLVPIAQIEQQGKVVMALPVLAGKVIFDQTFVRVNDEDKHSDFLVFICCGLVCSHAFLRMLYRNFQTSDQLKNQSFAGLLDELIVFYQKSGTQIDAFGQLFEEGFSEISNGYLLSVPMKKLLGCLLQLLWSFQVNQFSFHYKNFLKWLFHMGYPIEFPEQIVVSEYVEGVLYCSEKGIEASMLDEIGELGEKKRPTSSELLTLVDEYKTILKEIRR